ncbi:MAG: GatB/YqeY domain-containing protein [Dehalococcoidales bacterium]|nr:GatB/YqeY domain-containing protein [Dehalococcoidales bacterium]
MEQEAKLKQKFSDDLKQAMRDKDDVKKSTLRMLISAMNYVEIARQAPLTDPDILGVVAREIKQRQESILAFQQGNRPDLVAKEEAEMAVLKSYLPEQLSREAVVAAAKQVIAEVGAKAPSDKGKVMPKLIGQLKGKADGRLINDIVTELLKS